MDRRAFVAGVLLLCTPLAAEAQPPAKIPRIGFLSPNSPSDYRLEAFRQGLRELGYVEGQNISIEARWAQGKYDRLFDLAAELVRLKVDVIVTYTTPTIWAAQQATETIPIVMAGAGDPVSAGFVASLARPGRNITGLSLMAPELVGKQLEILSEVVPKATRVAVLGNPGHPITAPQWQHVQDAARALRLQLQFREARSPRDIDSAFPKMTKEGAGAVVVLLDVMLEGQRTRVAELATKRRLPSVFGLIDFAEAGGLMAYGADIRNRFRRVAVYMDKILKGAQPADLPVEQPTKFELVINLKTAKALGLTIPQSLLLRADEVIE